jgi:hypothetical protein
MNHMPRISGVVDAGEDVGQYGETFFIPKENKIIIS